VASGAVASVVSAAAWGQRFPGYGRPGGGARRDHPAPTGTPVRGMGGARERSWLGQRAVVGVRVQADHALCFASALFTSTTLHSNLKQTSRS